MKYLLTPRVPITFCINLKKVKIPTDMSKLKNKAATRSWNNVHQYGTMEGPGICYCHAPCKWMEDSTHIQLNGLDTKLPTDTKDREHALNPSAWSDGHCPHTVNITCRGVTGTARIQ